MRNLGFPPAPNTGENYATTLLGVFPLSISPNDIITLFDQTVADVWGEQFRRKNPAGSDEETATAWIELGATADQCSRIFNEQMKRMKLRRASLPRSLRIFDQDVRESIATGEPEEVDLIDCFYSRWRARLHAFIKRSLWREDLWGPPPGERFCRVPNKVLAEMKTRLERPAAS